MIFQFSPEAMTRTPQHQTGLVQVRSVALDPTLSPPGKETVGCADDLEVLFRRQGDRKIPSPSVSLLEVEDIFKNIYYKLITIYLLPAHAPNLPSILFQLVEDFISREVKLIKNHHDVLETFPFRQESLFWMLTLTDTVNLISVKNAISHILNAKGQIKWKQQLFYTLIIQ